MHQEAILQIKLMQQKKSYKEGRTHHSTVPSLSLLAAFRPMSKCVPAKNVLGYEEQTALSLLPGSK